MNSHTVSIEGPLIGFGEAGYTMPAAAALLIVQCIPSPSTEGGCAANR